MFQRASPGVRAEFEVFRGLMELDLAHRGLRPVPDVPVVVIVAAKYLPPPTFMQLPYDARAHFEADVRHRITRLRYSSPPPPPTTESPTACASGGSAAIAHAPDSTGWQARCSPRDLVRPWVEGRSAGNRAQRTAPARLLPADRPVSIRGRSSAAARRPP